MFKTFHTTAICLGGVLIERDFKASTQEEAANKMRRYAAAGGIGYKVISVIVKEVNE